MVGGIVWSGVGETSVGEEEILLGHFNERETSRYKSLERVVNSHILPITQTTSMTPLREEEAKYL